MTLLPVYTSEGCIGRCDANRYQAQEPHCDWICGGLNHRAGAQQAVDNTRQMAKAWIEKYAGEHGLTEYRSKLGQAVEQLDLF
jgi:hypothetical protein